MPDNRMQEGIFILRKSSQITTQWSGGTTTQLYIFPEDAEYSKRNFLFRISTATVEEDTSTFTSLPGVSRQLMILKGNFTIAHEGHYTMQMEPFDIDSFEGDWHTTGTGKVTDFNLMTTEGKYGTMLDFELKAGETFSDIYSIRTAMIGFYLWKGSAKAGYTNQSDELFMHDFMMIRNTKQLIFIKAIEDCRVIAVFLEL